MSDATGLTFIGRQPLAVPDVLDVLVVGAGPGGTAAALRGKELGLDVLVIDYDDVLKRIRDYSKDKLILPGFGGGDKMCFPVGGELVACLHFQPIDKDEMHLGWKRLYAEHDVPVQLGLELTGMTRRDDDGVWEVETWDHNRRREQTLAARHVVIAIGRGVPRRFDIPGNTDGIAFRLTDPELYVGEPACVIGGGTSAAEAVIAISHAKTRAGDPTLVHWSYRGTKLPRVSKALAEAFFEAYVGNGNVSYHPRSEPVMVLTGEDHREYLAVRVDRRAMAGRPLETVHLEFPKEHCIACIGEDIPEKLLNTLGIFLVPRGKRKRMVVNRMLETVQPDVYLVGDILSQAYLEADDFAADPETFREVRHRGNVKSALRDGVLVAQVIAQKLAGAATISVEIEDAPEPEPSAETPIEQVLGEGPRPAPPARPQTEPAGPRLVRLLAGDVEEDEVPLGERTTLGRGGCDLSFGDDEALAPHHATVERRGERYVLRDEGAPTGVFLRAPAGEVLTLEPGDLVRAGRHFLLVGQSGDGFELRHFDHQAREIGRHPVTEQAVIYGRDAPGVVLDAADRSLSRRHLAFSLKDGRVAVKDLKSFNGTYVRIRDERRLRDGDEFQIGRQHFRFLATADRRRRRAEIDVVETPRAAPRPAAPPGAPQPAPAAAGETGPSVTFDGTGETLPVRPGQTLCEVAEENGVAIQAECHSGICGSDPIRILSGAEHLSPLGDGEAETLEDLCGLEPGPCRLACMVRTTGPVTVEIVKNEP